MSDNPDIFEDDETEPQRNPLRDQLKAKEKRLAELERELQEVSDAKRELAFVKAGIDLANPASKYFVKAYDGELDPEAIRNAALEAHLMSSPDSPSDDEKDAWNRSNKVANGAGSPPPPVSIEARLSKAKSEREVMEILAEAEASR
jgi:hypothetical protein